MTPQDPLRREPYAGWADDGQPRPLPPAQPQGWVDPPRSGLLDDGYLVEPPSPEPTPRRLGCSVAVITLILALSGVPGVVASVPTPSEAPENRMGEAAGLTLAGAGEPAQGLRGAPQQASVSEIRVTPDSGGAPPTSDIGTAIYTASATWCAPTPDKCTDWGGNARLAAVNSFTWGDEPYPVRVHRGEMYVDVTVVSFCACHGEDGYIDLSPAAFEVLAPLGIGRIDVEVEVLTDLRPHPDDDRMRAEDGGPTLPATDATQ